MAAGDSILVESTSPSGVMLKWVTLTNTRARTRTTSTIATTGLARARDGTLGPSHWMHHRYHQHRGGYRAAFTTAAVPNNKPLYWPNSTGTSAVVCRDSDDYSFSKARQRKIAANGGAHVGRKRDGSVVATVCGLSNATVLSEAVGDSDSKRSRRIFQVDQDTGCFVPEPTVPIGVKVRGRSQSA